MEYQDWVDLSSYGAQFKRLNLPNGTSVPVVIVQDVEKFNSMATPLENFKLGAQNDIPFETLPGNKKGREFNQPILYMTKSFKDLGNTAYSVLPSLAKLLNISNEEVKALRKPMPENQIVSDIPYADVEKFTALTNSCFQAYAGNTLYAVKKPTDYENLVDYAERITETQHPLFPKSNVANIPFDTLDKFGLGTSIIGCAFLNPQDAKKSGYDLSELTRIHLEGEMSILPISVNNDLSINYISNVSEVSQLAYSNYKWKDNIGIINDYNALVAVHEASRMILNSRPSTIQTPDQFNGLIEKLSVTLQNFNESNGVNSSHKIIKYFNKGVTTHIIKNEQGEWRYIEKDASKKLDEPLNWANYQKALTTIANYNAILSGALELQVKQGAEFDKAMQVVFKNHHQFYKTNTQVVENLDDVKLDGRLIIHENGKKIHKQQVLGTINAHQRDMGETLHTEKVKGLLAGMRSMQDAGNIKNTTGQYVDDYTLQNNVTVVAGASESLQDNDLDDLGLSILDQMSQGQNIDFKRETNIQDVAVKPVVDASIYTELPKGISPKIDENYAEVSDIYKTLQHIELSQIPYYQNVGVKSKEELEGLTARTNSSASASFADYLKNGDAVFATQGESQAADLHKQVVGLQESVDQYDQIVDRVRIQANILRYQLGKYLVGLEQPIHGSLVFQSDAQGNYKPFEDATAYRTAVKLTQNAYEATNTDGLVARNSELSANLDAFVAQHYAVTAVDPAEPDNALATLDQTIEASQLFALPVLEKTEQLPILDEDVSTIHTDIAYRVNHAFTKYGSGQPSFENLDMALVAVARYADHINLSTGFELNPTNNPEYNSLIKAFSAYEGSLDYPGKYEFRSPLNGVVISDMMKVEVLKAVSDKSLSSIEADSLTSSLLKNLAVSTAEARIVAREKLELATQQQLMQKMSGQFLLNYQDSFKSSEKPSSDVYFYTVGGHSDSFRVQSAKNSQVPEDAIRLSNSNTLNIAVAESFAAYQVHQIANDIGITETTLSKIKELAQGLKDGDHQKVVDLSKAVFGHVLTPNDLSSFTFLGATDIRDVYGNRLVAVEASDLGRIEITHDESQKLVDSIGLCQKLAGIESDLRPNPLIGTIGKSAEFSRVQKYLMPELEEHGRINALIADTKTVFDVQKDLPSMAAGFAFTAYKNGVSQDLIFGEGQLGLATNTANNLNDVVYSRVVPAEWAVRFADMSKKDFNYSTMGDMPDGLTKDHIHYEAVNHIQYGVNSRPSIPVLATESTLNQRDLLTEGQASILQNAGGVNGSSVHAIEGFKESYAVANISAAINNLPASLLDEIKNTMEGTSDKSLGDIDMRVSVTAQDGITLPRIKFESFGAESSKDFVCHYTARDLKQLLSAGGFDIADLGKEPVMLDFDPHLYNTNNRFTERRGFDLQAYLTDASKHLGIDEIKIPDPAERVDALPPINIDEAYLSRNAILENSAFLKNILELQVNTDPSLTQHVTPLVNSAKVFLKAQDSQVSMALASSAEKCAEYANAGYTAIHEHFSPHHRPTEGFNIIKKLEQPIVTADDLGKADSLVARFFNVVDRESTWSNSQPLAKEPEPIAEEFLTDQFVAQVVKDIVNLDVPTVIRAVTTYPEKLNAFTFDDLEKMSATDLAQKINLETIWPKVSIETHLQAGHQNIDTLLLAQSLRDGISLKQPVLKEGSSLAVEASAYNFFLAEMHGAISKSKTPEELLVNFDKAYSNVTSMQPDFFARVKGQNELNKQCEVFNAFKKASHAHVVGGMTATEALNRGLRDNQQFMTHYDDVALSVGLKEKLYAQEKSFVHYMDGFTLNAKGDSLYTLNASIVARMDDVRQSTPFEYPTQETSNTAVHKDIVNTLNAVSPIDYNLEDSSHKLQSQWGVEFSVGPQDKHYSLGYAKIAESVLTEIHKNLGDQATMDQVGRGLSIQGGVPRDADNIKDIHLVDIAGGPNGSYQHFTNRYINQLVRRIEKDEAKLMTQSEISQFSAIKEDYQGIVGMSQRFGYEPKTDAGKALLVVHESLVVGSGAQPTNTSQSLLEHSGLVVANKLQEVERNVDLHKNDHTGVYAKHYVAYMEARQDGALKNLADKMRKMQSSNPDAPDMYHFVPAIDMLDKISNTATITGKSAVDKFVEEFHQKNPQSSKDSVALMLTTAIAEKPDSITQAQDYLATRAADKFIKLLDEYAPEGIKGTDQFIENLNKYFGAKLGENLQVEQMQYQSDFGHNQELEHKNSLINDPDHTAPEINADKVVYNYLNASIGGTKDIEVLAPEKENGLKLLAEVLVAHDKDRKLAAVAELRNERELRKDSSIDLSQ